MNNNERMSSKRPSASNAHQLQAYGGNLPSNSEKWLARQINDQGLYLATVHTEPIKTTDIDQLIEALRHNNFEIRKKAIYYLMMNHSCCEEGAKADINTAVSELIKCEVDDEVLYYHVEQISNVINYSRSDHSSLIKDLQSTLISRMRTDNPAMASLISDILSREEVKLTHGNLEELRLILKECDKIYAFAAIQILAHKDSEIKPKAIADILKENSNHILARSIAALSLGTLKDHSSVNILMSHAISKQYSSGDKEYFCSEISMNCV